MNGIKKIILVAALSTGILSLQAGFLSGFGAGCLRSVCAGSAVSSYLWLRLFAESSDCRKIGALVALGCAIYGMGLSIKHYAQTKPGEKEKRKFDVGEFCGSFAALCAVCSCMAITSNAWNA